MAGLSALDAVLRNACQVRLAEVVTSGGNSMASEIVADLSRSSERDRLRTAMAVESLPGFVCACGGDASLEFFDPHGELLTVVLLHHGLTLRWDGWESDAVLADGRLLLRWLDEHGLAGPLRHAEEAESRSRRAAAEEAAWVAAIPPALEELSAQMLALSSTGTSPSPDLLAEARERLSQAVPDPVSRVLLLLAWCGAGSGRWSGYPVHEVVPGLLLRDVPIAEIIAGLQDPRADGQHRAGALRHLLGWKSRTKQKRDIETLPGSLKARLSREAQASGDPDKRSRAERRLGQNRAD